MRQQRRTNKGKREIKSSRFVFGQRYREGFCGVVFCLTGPGWVKIWGRLWKRKGEVARDLRNDSSEGNGFFGETQPANVNFVC